jgi:hypothetical protein
MMWDWRTRACGATFRPERDGPPGIGSMSTLDEVSMVTPTYLLFALLAFIAMLVVLALFVILPDSGHFANI